MASSVFVHLIHSEMYYVEYTHDASNFRVGRTKGFARHNGPISFQDTSGHSERKCRHAGVVRGDAGPPVTQPLLPRRGRRDPAITLTTNRRDARRRLSTGARHCPDTFVALAGGILAIFGRSLHCAILPLRRAIACRGGPGNEVLRARHAPANKNARHRLSDANLHFMMRRQEALDAILSPDCLSRPPSAVRAAPAADNARFPGPTAHRPREPNLRRTSRAPHPARAPASPGFRAQVSA